MTRELRSDLSARYLYEISDYDGALQIIEVGYTACADKDSLLYADLCNTAGVCYAEKNFLSRCRSTLETSLRIRRAKLQHNNIDSKFSIRLLSRSADKCNL